MAYGCESYLAEKAHLTISEMLKNYIKQPFDGGSQVIKKAI